MHQERRAFSPARSAATQLQRKCHVDTLRRKASCASVGAPNPGARRATRCDRHRRGWNALDRRAHARLDLKRQDPTLRQKRDARRQPREPYSPTLNINVQEQCSERQEKAGNRRRRSRSASAPPSARCSGLTTSVIARHKKRRRSKRTSQRRRVLMAETICLG